MSLENFDEYADPVTPSARVAGFRNPGRGAPGKQVAARSGARTGVLHTFIKGIRRIVNSKS